MKASPKRGSGRLATSISSTARPASAVSHQVLRGVRSASPSVPRNSAAGVTDNARPSAGSEKATAVSTPKSSATSAGCHRPCSSTTIGSRSATICAPASASRLPSTTPAALASSASITICASTIAASRPSRSPIARSVASEASLPCRYACTLLKTPRPPMNSAEKPISSRPDPICASTSAMRSLRSS